MLSLINHTACMSKKSKARLRDHAVQVTMRDHATYPLILFDISVHALKECDWVFIWALGLLVTRVQPEKPCSNCVVISVNIMHAEDVPRQILSLVSMATIV